MKKISQKFNISRTSILSVCCFLTFFGILFSLARSVTAQSALPSSQHIITLHDDGAKKGFMTEERTLRKALEAEGIRIDENDRTEPSLDEALIARSYEVNIYRARPVIIRDGGSELKIITAFRTGGQIAKQAGIFLQDEDIVDLSPSSDVLSDGAAEVMTIDRALGVSFDFYGKTDRIYTQSTTVSGMLTEKNITIGPLDVVEPGLTTVLTGDMHIRLYRNGVQSITVEEEVAFPVEKISDANREIGFKEIQEPGEVGKRTVTYEINMENGVEVSRKELNSITTKEPRKQVEIVGAKRTTCLNDAGSNRILGHRMMLEAGFGEDQWAYLDKLWSHESGWIECKANYAGSGAYGIPQALPGSKMGPGWENDPEVQIRWGLGYIRGRYGNPQGAYAHWQAKNWY